MCARHFIPKAGLRPDWVAVALPTALAVQVFSATVSVSVIAVLVAISFIRRPEGRFIIQPGPLLLLFVASAIVISRPETKTLPAVFILVVTLTLRLVMTVDARRIISSLVDGWGIYLLANVIGSEVGLASPSLNQQISYLNESSGFVRIVFPFTGGLNWPPAVAGAYIVASVFLVREYGWPRRLLACVGAAAATYILVNVASRTALAVTAVLATSAIFFPFISRWIAQFAVLAASVSAFEFPQVYDALNFAIKPLSGLARGRSTSEYGVVSLEGREQIWDNSIAYWNQHITGVADRLLGFGEDGQYRSGASLTYSYIFRGGVPHPEHATVHNSFLQQLFDGGMLGWLFMTLAIYWASARLSRQRKTWGAWALAAIFALSTILFASFTEAQMSPGVHGETFWLLILLVGAACQGDVVNSGQFRRPNFIPSHDRISISTERTA